jgi:transposase-like protein
MNPGVVLCHTAMSPSAEVSTALRRVKASRSTAIPSRVTDKMVKEMTQWCHRPLEGVYPVRFIDAIARKVRADRSPNRLDIRSHRVTVNDKH